MCEVSDVPSVTAVLVVPDSFCEVTLTEGVNQWVTFSIPCVHHPIQVMIVVVVVTVTAMMERALLTERREKGNKQMNFQHVL